MISAYLHSVTEVLAELHERGFYADCSGLVTDHRRLTGPQDVFLAVLVKSLIRESWPMICCVSNAADWCWWITMTNAPIKAQV